MPNTPLQPGSTNTAAVKALQDYLVKSGYLTQAQVNTGYGTYGPATTAAVTKLQQDLGVDNAGGVGYFGPKTIAAATSKSGSSSQSSDAVKNLQASLGVPVTGVFDDATSKAMDSAVSKSIASNPDIKAATGTTDPAAILQAYASGDWSGIVGLSGKPFTDEQQQAAVSEAEKVLGPAYQEGAALDKSQAADTVAGAEKGFLQSQTNDRRQFGKDKETLDENAADQGVLFAGSRLQKQNDLRTTYQDRETAARDSAVNSARTALRGYQYNYGDDAAKSLSDAYKLPGTSTFSTATGGVTPGKTLTSLYDPGEFNFQGTKPVAQQAAVQTRAATQLANKANKLTLSGVGAKF